MGPSVPSEGALPAGGEILPEDAAWQPWDPWQVARRLSTVPVPWCVAGGWAVDLFLGEVTRDHEDVEIAVPRRGFGEIREALPELAFDVVGAGRRWAWGGPADEVMHQTWGRDPASGVYHLDVFREPHDGDVWICRRDSSIRRQYADVVRRTEDDVPYVAPEIALLFKARHRRPKDERDLRAVLPAMDDDARVWLADALQRVHPGHDWLELVVSSRHTR